MAHTLQVAQRSVTRAINYPRCSETLSEITFGWLPQRFDVVFVCGLYKSGTSFLMQLLNGFSYLDPSTLSNPRERAYGQSIERYYTRECCFVRQINDVLLPRTARANPRGVETTYALDSIALAADYLSSWKCPIVVKDPRFVYTLGVWLRASFRLGKIPCVCFTTRPKDELTKAWGMAPFTKPLLARGELQRMRECLCRQHSKCANWRVPFAIYDLESLKRINQRVLQSKERKVAQSSAQTVGMFA